MEKLIKLLNEYDKTNNYFNRWFRDEYWRLDREYGWSTVTSSCLKVISKEYGFIKWLVDNDKIDESLRNAGVELYHTSYNMHEAILMLLAIHDKPIEFLISILK